MFGVDSCSLSTYLTRCTPMFLASFPSLAQSFRHTSLYCVQSFERYSFTL